MLRQRATKAPLTFEILVTTRDQERIALAYQRDLKRAGIEATVRAVDPVQFDQRRLGYRVRHDPEPLGPVAVARQRAVVLLGQRRPPTIPGTRNYMGAKDPAIDAMIAAMLEARERPAFVSAVRALDRTLMSGFYAIPLFNVAEQWIARWNRIERPADHRVDRAICRKPGGRRRTRRNRSDARRDPRPSRIADARRPVPPRSWRGSPMRWRWSIRSTSRASPASRQSA